MSSLKFSVIFVFLLSLSSSSLAFTGASDPTYLYHICSDKNFTRNSAYHSNLNRLLSSLRSNDQFNRTTEGKDPNKAYGLFQCRGDVNTSTCQDCVTFASTDVAQRCPAQKGATIWYDECYFRYSDSKIFYDADLQETYKTGILMWNTNNVTIEPSRFHELLLNMMNKAADQAAAAPNKFAIIRGNSTTSQTMYSLLQCTQDLWYTDCRECLTNEKYRRKSVACKLYLPVRFVPVLQRKLDGVASSGTYFVSSNPCIKAERRARKKNITTEDEIDGNDILTAETLQFDLGTIQAATNRFSIDNKLGSGGFGVVYKVVLPNGKEVAVKRLTKRSGQGAEEFKNEVVVVAKLQHRNLVRLQGFCLEVEEKILVYEFVPNKSLDNFLYDPKKQGKLDWSRRYNIIGGIAPGILYLHEDFRLRIFHRDLKASNVLLDGDMNPKIADFGMARIVGVDQTQGNTSRIINFQKNINCFSTNQVAGLVLNLLFFGGYMAPEYAMQGQFSVKSDMYSFGVLVLEIITGKKNSSFYQSNSVGNLLSYAWELWRDETPMQLLDSNLTDSYSRDEVLRRIHIGLLCVQEDPSTRPSMATVVHMLNSYSVSPPLPQQPAFFIGSKAELNMHISDNSTSKPKPWSVDDASNTKLCPR
ncbi:hypothetical protein Ddye_019558 [Dipteronia dyeriana]|uniref:Cysteine-rich receptor-like protein kinase 10 n=1 Tax=Dipteronia dyeriana TaxID=168575 RepID=A0AAD9TZ13_9ROSI|nr:hypothetical protein Ddye_019558 [Dipteronia dyeriana]